MSEAPDWTVDVMRVGCPDCGASSHEPCWNDAVARERFVPHRARIRFSYSVAPTTDGGAA